MENTRCVVIGVDFSSAVMRAAPWVDRAIAPDAEIVLAHAAEIASVPSFLRALVPAGDDYRARQLRDAAARLDEWKVASGLTRGRAVVREGRADTVLLEVARESHADLMVIGAHGAIERPWKRLGTTAERLLRAAECSLLIVRGTVPHVPERILVALDDAEITPRVLAAAGALADRFTARLHAVHVLSNADWSHMLSAEAATAHGESDARAKLEQEVSSEALRWLQAMWKNTNRHGKLEVDVLHGSPGDEILAAAERVSADLIVIGRYGVGRVVPALLGSVVGTVAHGASCPVLVVSEASTRG